MQRRKAQREKTISCRALLRQTSGTRNSGVSPTAWSSRREERVRFTQGVWTRGLSRDSHVETSHETRGVRGPSTGTILKFRYDWRVLKNLDLYNWKLYRIIQSLVENLCGKFNVKFVSSCNRKIINKNFKQHIIRYNITLKCIFVVCYSLNSVH